MSADEESDSKSGVIKIKDTFFFRVTHTQMNDLSNYIRW